MTPASSEQRKAARGANRSQENLDTKPANLGRVGGWVDGREAIVPVAAPRNRDPRLAATWVTPKRLPWPRQQKAASEQARVRAQEKEKGMLRRGELRSYWQWQRNLWERVWADRGRLHR